MIVTADVGQLLLMIAGFLMALGALIVIMDRIESSLYDAVATRLDRGDDDLATRHAARAASDLPPAASVGPTATPQSREAPHGRNI